MVNTVNTVRASPEFKRVLQIVQEKGVNEDSITEILRTLYGPFLRGNVSITGNDTEFPCVLYSHT